jgi:hypothetical protein
VYNLYFVAFNHYICIYQPEFPSQAFPTLPYAVLTAPPTNYSRLGYILPGNPDSINNMIVDYLGNHEILLFCTDCGDVFFYYTRRLLSCRRDGDSDSDGSEEPQTSHIQMPRPDFRESVGKSAWGLSVHRNSRQLAVTSNSHNVTVFQFALVDPHQSSLPTAPPMASPNQTATDQVPYDSTRATNQRFMLPGASNLPCVSFCNTGEDPDGHVIAYGDITGNTCVWDLRKRDFVCWTGHFCKTPSPVSYLCSCLRQATFGHAIWGLHWLDTRCFRKSDSPSTHDATSQEPGIFDCEPSSVALVVPGSSSIVFSSQYSPAYPYQRSPRTIPGRRESDDDDGDYTDDSDYTDDGMTPRGEPDDTSPHGCNKNNMFTWAESTNGVPQIPACPLLEIGSKQISLHQPRDAAGRKGRRVVMNHPLRQIVRTAGQAYVHQPRRRGPIDRMSFNACIPELGCVVAASPTGRCAVISLMVDTSHPGKGFYSYRVEHFLPTSEEEEKGIRPGYELMGMAVGPLQGDLDDGRIGRRPRRWRLMLHYANDTVLSYELVRSTPMEPPKSEIPRQTRI